MAASDAFGLATTVPACLGPMRPTPITAILTGGMVQCAHWYALKTNSRCLKTAWCRQCGLSEHLISHLCFVLSPALKISEPIIWPHRLRSFPLYAVPNSRHGISNLITQCKVHELKSPKSHSTGSNAMIRMLLPRSSWEDRITSQSSKTSVQSVE